MTAAELARLMALYPKAVWVTDDGGKTWRMVA